MKNLFILLFIFLFSSIGGIAQNICVIKTPKCDYSGGDGATGPVVFTPASNVNNSVQIFTRLYPMLDSCVITSANIIFNTFSNVTSVDCPTSAYNCHGYAWHKNFYQQPYPRPLNIWIPNAEVPKYWSDNSFYEVFSPPVSVKGVILYYDGQGAITHSAVNDPNSSPMMYISKWGVGHLVRHSPTNVPTQYGSPSRYFLRCGACDGTPDLSKLTYNLGAVKYTVNFVAAGGYNMYTNLNRTCNLISDMTWTGNGNNWVPTGFGKLTVLFNISSGQSVTFTGNATNNCGSSSRAVTFVAQSSYRIASTA